MVLFFNVLRKYSIARRQDPFSEAVALTGNGPCLFAVNRQSTTLRFASHCHFLWDARSVLCSDLVERTFLSLQAITFQMHGVRILLSEAVALTTMVRRLLAVLTVARILVFVR